MGSWNVTWVAAVAAAVDVVAGGLAELLTGLEVIVTGDLVMVVGGLITAVGGPRGSVWPLPSGGPVLLSEDMELP